MSADFLQRKKAGYRRINSYNFSLPGRGRARGEVTQLDCRIHVLNYHIIVYVSFKNIFIFILFLINCKFM